MALARSSRARAASAASCVRRISSSSRRVASSSRSSRRFALSLRHTRAEGFDRRFALSSSARRTSVCREEARGGGEVWRSASARRPGDLGLDVVLPLPRPPLPVPQLPAPPLRLRGRPPQLQLGRLVLPEGLQRRKLSLPRLLRPLLRLSRPLPRLVERGLRERNQRGRRRSDHTTSRSRAPRQSPGQKAGGGGRDAVRAWADRASSSKSSASLCACAGRRRDSALGSGCRVAKARPCAGRGAAAAAAEQRAPCLRLPSARRRDRRGASPPRWKPGPAAPGRRCAPRRATGRPAGDAHNAGVRASRRGGRRCGLGGWRPSWAPEGARLEILLVF